MSTYVKSPAAVLDYEIDWSQYLNGSADTITASSWTADTGITLSNQSFTGTTTTVRVTGGALGGQYQISNLITLSPSNQIDQRTLTLSVEGT